MLQKYMLDTNIVIYVIKRRPVALLEIFNANADRMCISIITLAAFLLSPILALEQAGTAVNLGNLISILDTDPLLLTRAQTYAFTVLSISELFHAIGMRNTQMSIFRMNHIENKLMILAFLVGLVLQIAITEIPFLLNLFGTVSLSITEWLLLIAIATVPLWVHEIVVFIRWCIGKLKHA